MGYHLYHFYQDDEKLARVLSKFFLEGLRKLEYCMWIPREGITHDKAIALLKRHIPDIEDFLLKDQMRIEAFEDWYLTEDGKFDVNSVLKKWQERYEEVMENGFTMMRVSGETSSILKEYWNEIMEYERIINEKINDLNIAAVCTYKGIAYKPTEIQTILKHHFCPLTPTP